MFWQHDTFSGGGWAPVGGGEQGLYDEKWGENLASFFLVVGAAMVLCPVVAKVGRAGAPIILELFLRIMVTQPPKSYVHGFGSARQNIVGDNTEGGAVVSLGWGLAISWKTVRQGTASHALM